MTALPAAVKSLIDALKHGRSIEYFNEQFPSVSRQQAAAVLDQANLLFITPGRAA